MLEEGLKGLLAQLGLRQSEFAQLVGVSSRAVNMWAAGDVALPGPVVGYLRLLQKLPPDVRADEFKRLSGRDKMFDEGMYRFSYRVLFDGDVENGQALCVLRNGGIAGSDPWGGEFRGSYSFDPAHGKTRVNVVLTVPRDGMLVTGVTAADLGGEFEINGSFDRPAPESRAVVKVGGVPVEVALTYVGPLPR